MTNYKKDNDLELLSLEANSMINSFITARDKSNKKYISHDFKAIILDNCDRNIKISELVLLTGYSYSGFNKRFRQTFGVSPTFWIRERKIERVLKDISCNILSLKEIAYKHGFCSQSHLFVFCKKYYGKAPKELRSTTTHT